MSNSKFSWPADDWPALKAAVLEQVEFYLSSKNLRRDPRMLSRVLYNDEGYVKLSRIMRMHRMRSLPISSELVAKIIRDNSTRLQMSFSNVSVRRSPSLRAVSPLEDSFHLRVLVKNFPLSATAEEISAYLAPEATAVIRHSRFDVATYSHLFSGTVTTSFRSESECREFVESPLVLFQGNRLSRYHMVSGQNLDGFFGPGSVVRLDAPEGNFSRADIWFAVRRGSHVVANYVDYKEGVKVVWIRFCTAEDAMEFAGMRTLKVRKEICELHVADYEEEEAYVARKKYESVKKKMFSF